MVDIKSLTEYIKENSRGTIKGCYLNKDNKSPYWRIIFIKKNGKRSSISTKKKDKEDAAIVLENFIIEQKSKEENQKTDIIKIKDFKERYIQFLKGAQRSPGYIGSVNTTYVNFIKYFGEGRFLDNISIFELDNYIALLRKDIPKGCYVYLRTLKASFSKAVEWGLIKNNPLKIIKIPKRQRIKPDYLKEDEFVKIISGIKQDYIKAVCYFSFYTGARLGEALQMKWKNVDFENNTIVIGGDEFRTKNKKTRVVPFCGKLEEILHEMHEKENHKDNYIFRKNGIKLLGDHVSKNFKKAVTKSGINNAISFHSLRHSYASNLAQAGVPLITIKDLLGHSSIMVTEIYTHNRFAELQKAVNSVFGDKTLKLKKVI